MIRNVEIHSRFYVVKLVAYLDEDGSVIFRLFYIGKEVDFFERGNLPGGNFSKEGLRCYFENIEEELSEFLHQRMESLTAVKILRDLRSNVNKN